MQSTSARASGPPALANSRRATVIDDVCVRRPKHEVRRTMFEVLPGIPPPPRTPLMVRTWQWEVGDGNEAKAGGYVGAQA